MKRQGEVVARVIGLVLVTGLIFGFANAESAEPEADPDLGTYITAAVATPGELWVLGGERKLVTFNLESGARQLRLTGAIDLQKYNGRLLVLREVDHRAQVLEWKDGSFVAASALQSLSDGETARALIAMGKTVGIVTTRSMYLYRNTTWIRVLPHMPHEGDYRFRPDASLTTGTPKSGSSIYLGLNQGEWGGALDRVDVATGHVTAVVDTASPDQGEGRIEPVTSIIADPVRPDCVMVGIGVVHFLPFGKLVRACGDAQSDFFHPARSAEVNGRTVKIEEAFFGLVPARDGFWAVSSDAIYHFGSEGEPKRFILNNPKPWHGLWVSRDVPGALVVYTEINRRFSVNSGTPIIVALD